MNPSASLHFFFCILQSRSEGQGHVYAASTGIATVVDLSLTSVWHQWLTGRHFMVSVSNQQLEIIIYCYTFWLETLVQIIQREEEEEEKLKSQSCCIFDWKWSNEIRLLASENWFQQVNLHVQHR